MILGVLQARLSSTRLPGKVLKDLHGVPMILRQIDRIRRSKLLEELVVATSTAKSDDVLAELLEASGIQVRRGPLEDVLQRFGIVVDEFKPEHIVRLTADCPLSDPDVIDLVIQSHLQSGADYTANTLDCTFPDGLDVECISSTAFSDLRSRSLTEAEREHVTMGIYSYPDRYNLCSVTQRIDQSHLRWTVDVQDDFNFVESVYGALFDSNPIFGQNEITHFLDENPELSRTDDNVARNSGLNK